MVNLDSDSEMEELENSPPHPASETEELENDHHSSETEEQENSPPHPASTTTAPTMASAAPSAESMSPIVEPQLPSTASLSPTTEPPLPSHDNTTLEEYHSPRDEISSSPNRRHSPALNTDLTNSEEEEEEEDQRIAEWEELPSPIDSE